MLKRMSYLLLDILRNPIYSLKWPFLASLRHNLSIMCMHVTSKFCRKSAQKWLILSSKASYARCLFLVVSISCWGSSKQSDLPEPYKSVELLPFDGHGWYSNAEPLEQLIKTHKVKSIVEVGSWLGSSTRHMAGLLPEGGVLYAVDHWQGSSEHQEGEFAWYPALPYLYEQFLSNVIHAELTDKIIPMRMSSLEAATQLRGHLLPDLIYIDAGHDTESVLADLRAWYPFVRRRGILCGDDWLWDSVRAAVLTFARENQVRVISSGNFWRVFP